MKLLGQIRVDRGTGEDTPLQLAVDALRRGEAIGIFPQGTNPRGEEFYNPQPHGARPVSPAWPSRPKCRSCPSRCGGPRRSGRAAACRRSGELLARRPVYAEVGEPIHLKLPADRRPNSAAYHELAGQVMDAIAALMPHDVRNPPQPTDVQIELASPDGFTAVRERVLERPTPSVRGSPEASYTRSG